MTDWTRRDFGQALLAGGLLSYRPQQNAASPRATPATPASAGSLTDVPGIRVGHFTDPRRPTGCTAILFDPDVAAGVDYATSAPGEAGAVMLQPASPVDGMHAMLLTGGGPFGLPAFGGVIRYLEEQKAGFDWGLPNVRIPLVVGAVIDDLAVGDPRLRPDAEAAYKACAAASTGPVAEGSVGAGTGATVGKMHRSRGFGGMKGGIGTASLEVGDVVVSALAVVNAAGDILDWRSGRIVAGARRPSGGFADCVEVMKQALAKPGADLGLDDAALRSTTLLVVATNVTLTKTALTKVADMANCGASRAIRPYHTTGDGDQLYAVSTRRLAKPDLPLTTIGSLAADVAADAIVRGVRMAASVPEWPAVRDL
jgi:L-aminopeptidase/D-esterase-like protein